MTSSGHCGCQGNSMEMDMHILSDAQSQCLGKCLIGWEVCILVPNTLIVIVKIYIQYIGEKIHAL